MSLLKKDHILGTGTAAVACGALGAAIGAVAAGPPGLAVGAVIGGVAGALYGNRTAEARDTRGDLGHFEQIHRKMGYFQDGMEWTDYAPAYRYGIDTYRSHGGRPFAEVEADLASGWGRARDDSRLAWVHARPAVEHAWRELGEAVRAKG